jgi:hypothetical protein
MTAQNISFAVSTEELLVILGYLKVDSMPGLDGSHLQGLDEGQMEFALGIAERALYARGFIIPDPQKKPVLAPTVFSMVGACVMPEVTIVLSCNRPKQRQEEYYYHISRGMAVMHYSLNEGIQQFVAVSERATIAQSILSTLKLREKSALKCPPIQIKASLFGEMRKALNEDRFPDASRLLTESGLNSASAQAMLETQQHPVANTTIGYLKGRDGEVTASGFTVIEGDNGLWIATSPENKLGLDADLLISPASIGDVIERVRALVNGSIQIL